MFKNFGVDNILQMQERGLGYSFVKRSSKREQDVKKEASTLLISAMKCWKHYKQSLNIEEWTKLSIGQFLFIEIGTFFIEKKQMALEDALLQVYWDVPSSVFGYFSMVILAALHDKKEFVLQDVNNML